MKRKGIPRISFTVLMHCLSEYDLIQQVCSFKNVGAHGPWNYKTEQIDPKYLSPNWHHNDLLINHGR
jgi:hypothetical protein